MTEDRILAVAGCGCTVAMRGEELHVWPCSDAHYPAVVAASEQMAAALGVPCVETE